MYYRPWPIVTDCNDASKPLDFWAKTCNTKGMKNETAMTATYQTNLDDPTFNGWSNYETWNVALWIGNDEGLYDEAKCCGSYSVLLHVLYGCGSKETPDGVKWTDPKVNHIEIDDMIEELG
jgi:hypothetical protein